jgi:hypothetical protein
LSARRRTNKVSATVKAYRKERSRVLATVRRYEKQGLYVDFVVPNIPKRITQASVRRLSKITPKKIQARTFMLSEYGEIEASFYQFKKAQREKAQREKAKKLLDLYDEIPQESHMVIANFRGYVSQFNEWARGIINSWLDNLLFKHTENEVAGMLQKASEQGELINYKVVYTEKLFNALSSMMDFMDLGPIERESMIEALEYEENYEV